MAALMERWQGMTAWQRLAMGAALAAAIAICYYYQRLAPRLLANQAAAIGARDLATARAQILQAEQSLASLRQQNRQLLGAAGGEGQGALAVLAQIDQAIAAAGMLLLSRDGGRAAPPAAPPPHLRPALAAPPAAALPAADAAAELPTDIDCVSYRHAAIGSFEAALQLLRALSALTAPCRFQSLALTSRDPADGRGSVTLEFEARIYFRR